jgi:hypothetical protein
MRVPVSQVLADSFGGFSFSRLICAESCAQLAVARPKNRVTIIFGIRTLLYSFGESPQFDVVSVLIDANSGALRNSSGRH